MAHMVKTTDPELVDITVSCRFTSNQDVINFGKHLLKDSGCRENNPATVIANLDPDQYKTPAHKAQALIEHWIEGANEAPKYMYTRSREDLRTKLEAADRGWVVVKYKEYFNIMGSPDAAKIANVATSTASASAPAAATTTTITVTQQSLTSEQQQISIPALLQDEQPGQPQTTPGGCSYGLLTSGQYAQTQPSDEQGPAYFLSTVTERQQRPLPAILPYRLPVKRVPTAQSTEQSVVLGSVPRRNGPTQADLDRNDIDPPSHNEIAMHFQAADGSRLSVTHRASPSLAHGSLPLKQQGGPIAHDGTQAIETSRGFIDHDQRSIPLKSTASNPSLGSSGTQPDVLRLQAKLADYQQQFSNLEEKYQKATEENDLLHKENDLLHKENAKLKKEIQQRKEQKVQIHEEMDMWKRAANRFERQLIEKTEGAKEIKKERDQFKLIVERYKELEPQLEQKIAQLSAENKHMKEEMDEREQKRLREQDRTDERLRRVEELLAARTDSSTRYPTTEPDGQNHSKHQAPTFSSSPGNGPISFPAAQVELQAAGGFITLHDYAEECEQKVVEFIISPKVWPSYQQHFSENAPNPSLADVMARLEDTKIDHSSPNHNAHQLKENLLLNCPGLLKDIDTAKKRGADIRLQLCNFEEDVQDKIKSLEHNDRTKRVAFALTTCWMLEQWCKDKRI